MLKDKIKVKKGKWTSEQANLVWRWNTHTVHLYVKSQKCLSLGLECLGLSPKIKGFGSEKILEALLLKTRRLGHGHN